jgi:hypothetical protein
MKDVCFVGVVTDTLIAILFTFFFLHRAPSGRIEFVHTFPGLHPGLSHVAPLGHKNPKTTLFDQS